LESLTRQRLSGDTERREQSGNLKSRLYRHRRNRDEALVFSYGVVDDGEEKHKREQVETDLIGAHWLVTEEAPRDEF